MSTHPNVILMAMLTPDDLARKTMREIYADNSAKYPDDEIKIANEGYSATIMEAEWDEGFQIPGKEGDLVFLDFVTYGYGDTISWDTLAQQKQDLEEWAKKTCKKHHCSYRILVTANYW